MSTDISDSCIKSIEADMVEASLADAPNCPPVGIHQNVPFDDYLGWPALNFSTLKWAGVSAEHLRAALDGQIEDDDSKARKFGRAVHCRLLEPDRYRQEFLVASPCCGILQSGDNRGEPCGKIASRYDPEEGWFCGIHGKRHSEPPDYVSQSDAEEIERIAEKIRLHDVVRLFRQTGGFEASIVWEPRPGIVGKARLDKLINTDKIKGVCDIKKAQVGKASFSEAQRSIENYSWNCQAAWYTDAAKDSMPHALKVWQADNEEINEGRKEYNDWLDKYEAGMQSGSWPGYGPDIGMMSLSAWYKRR